MEPICEYLFLQLNIKSSVVTIGQVSSKIKENYLCNLVEKFVRMGARYVSTGTDLGFLLAACTAKAKAGAALTV